MLSLVTVRYGDSLKTWWLTEWFVKDSNKVCTLRFIMQVNCNKENIANHLNSRPKVLKVNLCIIICNRSNSGQIVWNLNG